MTYHPHIQPTHALESPSRDGTKALVECKPERSEAPEVAVSPRKKRKKGAIQLAVTIAEDGTLCYKNTPESRCYKTFTEAERWLKNYEYMLENWRHSDLPDAPKQVNQLEKEIEYIQALLKRKPPASG